MKKLKLNIIALALLGLAGCYSDDSKLATIDVSDITITELEGERAISFAGYVLERQPEITTGYPEEQLSYAWYLCQGTNNDGYRQELIGSEKNLAYEINLPMGTYTVVYEVSSKENSYTVTSSFTLTVTTEFAQGYWVLKETADGNTELDLHTSDTTSMPDLLTKLEGAPLSGAPRNLTVAYSQKFIDTKADEMVNGNTLCVVTENNEINVFRTEDMLKVFDSSNLLFAGPSDETHYAIVRGMWTIYYFTSAGVRRQYVPEADPTPSSGKFGYVADAAASTPDANIGSSKHIQLAGNGQNVIYWNEQRHRLERVDYNGTVVTEINLSGAGATPELLDKLDVVTYGYSAVPSARLFFLFQDRTDGTRYLCWLASAGTSVSAFTAIDPTLHLARSNMVCGNGKTAAVIYCLDDNKLFSYNTELGTERELLLPEDIPTGSNLSYVCDLYNSIGTTFNYLVIGTREGNDYTLYLYTILGGQPDVLTHTFKGTGRVEKLRYAAQASLGLASGAPRYPF
jgi:hypothetical protein